MKTIKEWQVEAHRLSVEKGFHSRMCPECERRPQGQLSDCMTCGGRGYVDIDPHSPTRIAARLAAIHGEISEAYECVARGRMDVTVFGWAHNNGHEHAVRMAAQGHKPDGFGIELADVFLRLCDLAESLGVTLTDWTDPNDTDLLNTSTPEHVAGHLNDLHTQLACASGSSARLNELDSFLAQLLIVARSCGVDLLACAELKMEYNKTRPVMHGKRL